MNETVAIIVSLTSVIVAATAVIVPPFITLRTHRMDIEEAHRQHDHDFYELHRAEVIERYLSAASAAVDPNTRFGDSIQTFNRASGEVYIYIDESLWPLLDEIHRLINESGDDASDVLQDLCKELAHHNIRRVSCYEPSRKTKKYRQNDISHEITHQSDKNTPAH